MGRLLHVMLKCVKLVISGVGIGKSRGEPSRADIRCKVAALISLDFYTLGAFFAVIIHGHVNTIYCRGSE